MALISLHVFVVCVTVYVHMYIDPHMYICLYTFIYIWMHMGAYVYECIHSCYGTRMEIRGLVPSFYLVGSVDRFQASKPDGKYPRPPSLLSLAGWTFCGCGCFTAAMFFLSVLIMKVEGEGW